MQQNDRVNLLPRYLPNNCWCLPIEGVQSLLINVAGCLNADVNQIWLTQKKRCEIVIDKYCSRVSRSVCNETIESISSLPHCWTCSNVLLWYWLQTQRFTVKLWYTEWVVENVPELYMDLNGGDRLFVCIGGKKSQHCGREFVWVSGSAVSAFQYSYFFVQVKSVAENKQKGHQRSHSRSRVKTYIGPFSFSFVTNRQKARKKS